MGQEGKGPVIRANIKVRGIVQGVGFRPFIHRQVSGYGLKGWVRNTSDGAEIEVEGPEGLIDRFAEELWTKKPLLALIEDVRIDKTDDLRGYDRFEIAGSRDLGRRNTLITPDVAVCEDCLRELRDPSDRRYRYPYINCTNCGPRFTIIKDVPYDRAKTTMAEFPMCGTCEGEYTNIENRRYHAEPTCCPDCGPGLIYCRADGRPANGDPVKLAAEDLKAHRIVAVKGLGGYHLACLFDDDETPARLRERKRRDEKPFAVMCRDLDAARKICEVDETEERLLLSGARPIVLLKKKDRGSLMNVSENGRVGVMLPYTPVHHLLFDEGLESLIMTSANLSDLPIIYKDDEALRELADIADGFLMGEREIHTRCDDSLVYGFDGKAYPVRRSRGYVPYPLRLQGADAMILACGAEQKASFCISREGSVFPSQHIGDLKNLQTFDNYSRQIAHFENMFSVRPQKLVCDLHPDYFSTSYAEERSKNEGIPLIKVQHHWAHMASCMADNGLEGDVIGVIWDGTGLGTDGTIWGGEFLAGGYEGFSRLGTIGGIKLPGGDRAVEQLWRTGISMLLGSGIDPSGLYDEEKISMVRTMIGSGLNCPASSGMGRLFDGAASVIGIRQDASYEGQGAVLLEAAAAECGEAYPFKVTKKDGLYIFDKKEMLRAICDESMRGVEKGLMAARFMNTMVRMAEEMCVLIREDTGLDRVCLSGGSFQNIYMLERLVKGLGQRGFQVFHHSRVPANDEGIAFGQLAIAAKGNKDDVPCGTA